jgi:signal transduction histidine kinase
MDLARLKWLTIVLPIAFVLAVHGLVLLVLEPRYGDSAGNWLAIGMVGSLVAGIVVFSTVIFRVIATAQREVVRKNEELAARSKGMQALNQIGLEINSLQDVKQTLRSIVDHAREIMVSDAASLCLLEADGTLVLAGCSGPPEAFRRSPVQTPPVAVFADSSSERFAPDSCPVLTPEFRACCMSSPVRVGETRIGELCVCSRSAQTATPFQTELLAGLADMAAIALNNARLLERQRYVAVLEERERLSREMHDSLAQVLGYLHLKALSCKELMATQDTTKTTGALEEIASLAHEAYVDVREGIVALREQVSPEAGILGTLEDYLGKFRRQSGIDVTLHVRGGEAVPLSPDAELQVLRVVQEALTNVRKHSGAEQARVTVAPGPGLVRFTVQDNGRGFHLDGLMRDESHGLGLRTMRERIQKVGGRFTISSRPDCGTTVEISFPMTEGGTES